MCKCNHQVCGYCGKSVNLNKFIFGSLHICATEQQRNNIDRARSMMRAQLNENNAVGLSDFDKFVNHYKQQQ